DPWNINDIKEIEKSPNTNSIKPDFYKSGLWHNHSKGEFYALQDIETGEIVSACELTRHYSPYGKYWGDYIMINQLEGNPDYVDSLTPMVGFIANKGQKTGSRNIVTGYFSDNIAKSLKGYKFTRTDGGEWVLPSRRFEENIEKAENRTGIEFLA
ncbi:hypothetical protein IJ531_05265, partial [bacterium]|nr:hypothetical protein [bacterium]